MEGVDSASTHAAMVLPIAAETVEVEVDLRPGGKFYTVMQSPEAQKFPNMGCYLEIVENSILTWTSALAPGFRPVPELEALPSHECAEFLFTATILLEPHGSGTKYTAIAQHRDNASKLRHAQMGFEEGWGACLDQLVAMVKAW